MPRVIERSSCFGRLLHLCVTNALKFWGEINIEQVVEYDSDDNDDELEEGSTREQEIDADEDDLPNAIDEDIANTASV